MASSAAVLASLGLVSSACSSGRSTPTSSQYDDVAQSVSALVGTSTSSGEVHSMSDAASLALGVTPTSLNASGQGTFGGISAGLNYSYTVTCADATGAALSACGSATNSAHATVSWSGSLTTPDLTASVNRTGDYSVAGLQSGHVTFDGAGSFNSHAQFQSLFRQEQATASLALDGKYTAVSYDKALGHLTGGTIAYTVNASLQASSTSGQGGGSFVIDAVLAFNPDGSATLTLDGSHTYNLTASGILLKG